MDNPYVPRVGGTLSADIAVPERKREVHFYSHILSTGDNPLWREDLSNNLGWPIIGLGEQNEDYADLPLQWMPHIQVDDVAASVKRALGLGATELLHGKDDQGNSQWAVLLDLNQVAFGIVPLVPPEAVPQSDEPVKRMGCISWLDLTVSNASATRDFYKEVIGWSVEEVDMQDSNGSYADYNMLGSDGKPAAGICHARGVNLDLPPVWMLYLPVGDLAESLRRVEVEGGKIIQATEDGKDKFTYAVIQDPVGVYFALVPG
jgi:uncharacterized protein